MRGGEIYIGKDVGYRAGIHMKEYVHSVAYSVLRIAAHYQLASVHVCARRIARYTFYRNGLILHGVGYKSLTVDMGKSNIIGLSILSMPGRMRRRR